MWWGRGDEGEVNIQDQTKLYSEFQAWQNQRKISLSLSFFFLLMSTGPELFLEYTSLPPFLKSQLWDIQLLYLHQGAGVWNLPSRTANFWSSHINPPNTVDQNHATLAGRFFHVSWE